MPIYYSPQQELSTHRVSNQAKELIPLPLWKADPALQDAFNLWATEAGVSVQEFANQVGSAQVIDWGWRANQTKPRLMTHDRFGHRVDEVDFHPAYHHLMDLGISQQVSSVAWQHLASAEKQKAPASGHLSHAAKLYLLSQVEAGVCCPLSMTYAATSVLAQHPEFKEVVTKLVTPKYDPEFKPMAQKAGITMGMAMTEKQGGSDVRANQTTAEWTGEGKNYLLTGHKWFCSAPMSDAFLTLAKVEGQLTCFFLPRWTPDDRRNHILIQRLKDKMGNHANASSEVEFNQAWAQQVGEVGAGVRTIIEMVHHTRLDASLANASIMRRAVTQAFAHCAHRSAFGKTLINQPLMRTVLADLWLESEAATWTTMYLAHCFDQASYAQDQNAKLFTRLATAVVKYWICKRTPNLVYEALECHGGAGYVEESIMPRLFRESPLNSIWEGSGNVICLDILRAMHRSPETTAAFMAELNKAKGHHSLLDQKLLSLQKNLHETRTWNEHELACGARFIGAELAVTLQASLLCRFAPSYIAEAFCLSRLGSQPGRVYGDLHPKISIEAVLKRADALLALV